MSRYVSVLGAIEEEMAENPTVVEVGFPPVRVTIPVTSKERKREAWVVGASMFAIAGIALWAGSSYFERVIRLVRG